MSSRYASKVWKCLPIYDDYGVESYKKYLFKLIVEMSQNDSLTDKEQSALRSLKGLRNINDIASKEEIRSLILSCSALLYRDE